MGVWHEVYSMLAFVQHARSASLQISPFHGRDSKKHVRGDKCFLRHFVSDHTRYALHSDKKTRGELKSRWFHFGTWSVESLRV